MILDPSSSLFKYFVAASSALVLVGFVLFQKIVKDAASKGNASAATSVILPFYENMIWIYLLAHVIGFTVLVVAHFVPNVVIPAETVHFLIGSLLTHEGFLLFLIQRSVSWRSWGLALLEAFPFCTLISILWGLARYMNNRKLELTMLIINSVFYISIYVLFRKRRDGLVISFCAYTLLLLFVSTIALLFELFLLSLLSSLLTYSALFHSLLCSPIFIYVVSCSLYSKDDEDYDLNAQLKATGIGTWEVSNFCRMIFSLTVLQDEESDSLNLNVLSIPKKQEPVSSGNWDDEVTLSISSILYC